MTKFDNPLDNIRVASPCEADWNEMYGDERLRFCSDCKLNVYNLSDMSRGEAETFLLSSAGRVCVKFYRRFDGTVLTDDCPLGLKAVKKRVSQISSSACAMIAGFLAGVLGLQGLTALTSFVEFERVPAKSEESDNGISFGGIMANLPEVQKKIQEGKKEKRDTGMLLGRVETIRDLKDEKVVAWIQ